jgi:glycosyltransferase involved in cell wall biosynthesis
MLPSRDLLIIIPAHNEELRIGPTVADYCTVFERSANILVVANGCTDNTCGIVRALQDAYPNLGFIDVPGRIGKGGAVRVGFCTGSESFVGFVDADGSTNATEFSRLFERLRASGKDAVIGSRWIPGAVVDPPQPLSRRAASRTFNAIVRLLFGIPYADTQCGAKIFSRRGIAEIFKSLEVANFAFDIELLWRLRRAGFTVLEEPTNWSDRTGTKVRLAKASWNMFVSLLRMRIRETAWWFVPFIDRFGEGGTIPVIERRRLLLVRSGAIGKSEQSCLEDLLDKLRAQGFEVVDSDVAIEELWLRRLCERRDVIGSAALLYWYGKRSHRNYDGVIEVADKRTTWLPSFSTKPTFVVSFGENPELRARLMGNSKATLLDFEEITPAQAAETVAYVESVAAPYAVAFINATTLQLSSEGDPAWRLTEFQR